MTQRRRRLLDWDISDEDHQYLRQQLVGEYWELRFVSSQLCCSSSPLTWACVCFQFCVVRPEMGSCIYCAPPNVQDVFYRQVSLLNRLSRRRVLTPHRRRLARAIRLPLPWLQYDLAKRLSASSILHCRRHCPNLAGSRRYRAPRASRKEHGALA